MIFNSKNNAKLTPLVSFKAISKFKLLSLISAGLLAVTVILLLINADVDLMVKNESGEKLKIISCLLNGIPVLNCEQELPSGQAVFINPQRSSYPKNNIFSIHVVLRNEGKGLSCQFTKAHRECVEEMSLTKEGLVCAADCTSVYQ